MSLPLEQFIHQFVVPMLVGGDVCVGPPLSIRDRAKMLKETSALEDHELIAARQRRAQLLVADPELEPADSEELALWMGLHGLLSLDHPDHSRVWARNATWRKVEDDARSLLQSAWSEPNMSSGLARHVAVGAFLELMRDDYLVRSVDGEVRYLGQLPSQGKFGLLAAMAQAIRIETIRWIEYRHEPACDRLLMDVMWVSPLSCLLQPQIAPPNWSPLTSICFLQCRSTARSICYRWDRSSDWLRIGAELIGRTLQHLQMVQTIFKDSTVLAQGGPASHWGANASHFPASFQDPNSMAALRGETAEPPTGALGCMVAALIHLHLLKVLDYDARIGLGISARDWAVQAFLSLPLLLPHIEKVTGSPLSGTELTTLGSRWQEYTSHLRSLVPRPVVHNMLACVGNRIVEEAIE